MIKAKFLGKLIQGQFVRSEGEYTWIRVIRTSSLGQYECIKKVHTSSIVSHI